MLLKIREATAGKFSYFIVAIISIPFALWGVNYYFQGGVDPVVLEVGDTEITLSQFNAQFNQRKRDLEATLDASEMPPDAVIQNDVLGALTRAQLLAGEADKYRYHVPDSAVAAAIVEVPEFMTDGRFDRERYHRILQVQGQSQAKFERGIREQLRKNQLYSVIKNSHFVLPTETRAYEKFLSQERHVRYLEFPVEKYTDPAAVSSSEVVTYYAENKQQFLTSEEFRLAYVELKMDDIAANVTVTEAEARIYYDDNLDLFAMPEERSVAHILFDIDRHGEQAAAARAREAYEQLRQGEDFAGLAAAYSDDSLTAGQGGVLPPLAPGDTEAETEDVIFALRVDEFSEPLKSDFGLQIFKLIDIRSSGVRSFGEARNEIEEELRRDRAERLYGDDLARLELLAYERAALTGIPRAIPSLGKIKDSGWLAVAERRGIFQYPPIREVVYTERVLRQDENSAVVEISPGHVMVVRLADEQGYRPSEQKPLEQVKDDITAILLKDHAWVSASAAMEQALSKLQDKSATLDDLAGRHELPLHDVSFIRRGGLPNKPMIAYTTFLLPETPGSHVRTRMRSAESYAIVELVAVRQGELPTEEQQGTLFEAAQEFNAVLIGILKDNSVEIHPEVLAAETQ